MGPEYWAALAVANTIMAFRNQDPFWYATSVIVASVSTAFAVHGLK